MKPITNWLVPVLSLSIFLGLAYGFERTDTIAVQACFASLFFFYFFMWKKSKSIGLGKLIIWGLLSRLVFALHIPYLSDDFYRFLFDGHLILQGLNPYAHLPSEAIQFVTQENTGFMKFLFEKMNSQNYYSVYPPLHQALFAWAALGGESLLWNLFLLRIPLILADLGIVFFLWKLLPLYNQDQSKILLYWLNPLVIAESTGNLHFEVVVLFGILGSLWFYKTSQPVLSAGLWSFSIGIKLIPAILGAFWLRVYPIYRTSKFWIATTIFCAVTLFPLWQANNFQHFYQSFRLYQSSFEFNASIYYVLKYLSSFWLDYNPIATLGPTLNLLAIIAMLSYAWKKSTPINLAEGFMGTYLIYLLLQTTVHPWYIIPVIGISLLTRYYSVLLWSGLIVFSYTAYSTSITNESVFFLLIQYIPFLTFAAWEFYFRPQKTRKIHEKLSPTNSTP